MDEQHVGETGQVETIKRIIPAEYRCLSGSVLKLIACATMLIDHVAAFILVFDPAITNNNVVLFGVATSWYLILRNIGRIAFPIYVFLLVEGFFHTRSRACYGISLLVFALISEPIWDFVRFGVFYESSSQNVYFTLLVAFLAMYFVEEFANEQLISVLGLVLCVFVAYTFNADYGPIGLALALVTYGIRKHEALRFAASECLLYSEPWAALAFPLMALYIDKRGFVGKGAVAKYAFYAFYPAHLLVLGLILVWMGVH